MPHQSRGEWAAADRANGRPRTNLGAERRVAGIERNSEAGCMRHVAADETAGESDADPQILRGTRRKAASVGDLYHHCHHVSE